MADIAAGACENISNICGSEAASMTTPLSATRTRISPSCRRFDVCAQLGRCRGGEQIPDHAPEQRIATAAHDAFRLGIDVDEAPVGDRG